MAKFKARARAVDMLGRQQIAGVPNAISELFKNAHDAYADRVVVDYFKSDQLFVLRDDGLGMTKNEFEERWLTLGTESKLGDRAGLPPPPKDPEKQERPITGEKGIGRLAIAAVGPQVLILTRAERSGKLHDLVAAFIHWGLFEIPGINLDEIEIPILTFPGGTFPSRHQIREMTEEVKGNIRKLGNRLDKETVQRILGDLDNFICDIESTAEFIGEPSLTGNGRGTHFYIRPATTTLAEDVEFDYSNQDDISRLRRLLVGFTNTMTPDSPRPTIDTAFRYWPTNEKFIDLLEERQFFTPEEFQTADHHISGNFDEFGYFNGTVTIYGQDPIKYSLPWPEALGETVSCGPFRISFAYVQGQLRESRIPPEEYAQLSRKLKLIGGLYIYRDNIRILPYGDADVDFLEIEKRRTFGAGYYFFSYRRIFGVIEITRERNENLVEKAGREGFQENKAYREFKAILINFFVQLAADFFREKGEFADLYIKRKEVRSRREMARREAERRGKSARKEFERQLNTRFGFLNSGEPKEKTEKILTVTESRLKRFVERGQPDMFGDSLVDIEADALRSIDDLRLSYRVERPNDVGLTQDLGRDWAIYLSELERLQKEVFAPAEQLIQEMVVKAAEDLQVTIDRHQRINRLVQETIRTSLDDVQRLARQTNDELQNMFRRVDGVIRELLKDVRELTNRIKSEIESLDIDEMDQERIDGLRRHWENQISKQANRSREILNYLTAQLQEVDWGQGENGDLVGSAEMRAALEEEVLALRDQADAVLEFTQLGMAIEIISHEFNNTIRAIRSNIRELKRWADANPDLYPLYREIRNDFEHLDGQLTLFTPFQRRLYRKAIEIKGSSIAKYLRNLFERRLQRYEVELVATADFKDKTITGYPSSFYPVFVNLVDNAIFWLKDRTQPREIHLDADKNGFLIWDTGPGISIRDREAVFERGFTRKPGGHGLGLYISREVLKREGFDLKLDRPTQERGAMFRIIPKESITK